MQQPGASSVMTLAFLNTCRVWLLARLLVAMIRRNDVCQRAAPGKPRGAPTGRGQLGATVPFLRARRVPGDANEGRMKGGGCVASYGCKHTRTWRCCCCCCSTLVCSTQRPPWVVMLGDDRVMSAAAALCALKVKATGLILCKRARARPTGYRTTASSAVTARCELLLRHHWNINSAPAFLSACSCCERAGLGFRFGYIRCRFLFPWRASYRHLL